MARTYWMTTLSVGLALALSACGAADDTGEEPGADASDPGASEAMDGEAPAIGSLQQPLRRGSGGGGLGYTCSGLKCTCTGDVDCNDMFSDGVCGDIASCDTTDPLNPVCECLILRVKQPLQFAVATPTLSFQAVR